MKKRTKLLCIALLTTAFGALSYACTDADEEKSANHGNQGSSVTVGGETLGSAETQPQILGAKDWHIPVNAQVDFGAGVYAQVGTDSFGVEVNSTAVNLATQGEYTITYTFEQTVVEKKVYVYGEIAFSDTTPTVEAPYSDAFEAIYQGFTAKDGFGTELEVQLLKSNGLYNTDGTLNIGTFSVEFIVVDNAGQTKKLTRTVTVTEETSPTLDSKLTYDVADDTLYLALQNSNITGISVDGKLATLDVVEMSKDSLVLDGAWIYSLCAINESVQIRLISATGWTASTLTVKDEKAVQYDDTQIQAFAKKYYACDSEVVVPEITLTNKRQQVTPVYSFVQNSNSEVSDGTYTFTQSGAYTLQIDLRGNVLEYEVETYFDLGLKDGMVFSRETGFTATPNPAYEIIAYKLTDKMGKTNFAEYRVDSDTFTLDAFKASVKALNVSQNYRLTATALRNGKKVTQTVDCYMADKAGQSVLSEKSDGESGKMYAWNTAKTSLSYEYQQIGGRRGTFKWESLVDGSNANESSLLGFDATFISKMKKGTYLTFDIYTDSAIAPFFYTNSAWFGLWDSVGGATYFATKVDKGSRTDITTYTAPVFAKVYDENGTQITKGSFNAGSFNGKWITVEICLPEDMGSPSADGKYNYNGLCIYPTATATGTLSGKNIYLSNVRISETSLMSDTTVNPVVPEGADSKDGTGVIVDLWLGKDEEMF